MEEIITYLIEFLLASSDKKEVASQIGYTANPAEFSKYSLVIIPSKFFESNFYGSTQSLPTLPLAQINDIPVLYGENKIESINGCTILHADLIASAYFLLSRYEELVRKDGRDVHGRFMGKESLAYKANFLHRPIVEEYGKLLRTLLRQQGLNIQEPEAKISKVYLTHDVDQPFFYQKARNLLGAVKRSLLNGNLEIVSAIKAFRGDFEQDPAYSFPWIFEKDTEFSKQYKGKSESILFFKSAVKTREQDFPLYSFQEKGIQAILHGAKQNNISIGLHASYRSGDEPQLVAMEKERLELGCKQKISYNRHHYLRAKNIMDMEYLIQAGITDDFTMGYADVAGFRLGTCRAVQFINAETKQLRPLLLHPLPIMEITLTDKRYMNLSFNEAFEYCKVLIDGIKSHAGELSLLWHNQVFAKTEAFDHRKLYSNLLDYIINNQEK